MKKAGILLAISSLPSSFGIGDLGHNAYEFVDILKRMKSKVWQVLPLTPLGFGSSPYQSSSSFAGDDIYISIDKLVDDGLLDANHMSTFNSDFDLVEYAIVREYKNNLYNQSFMNFTKYFERFKEEYQKFIDTNSWAFDYAVFKTFSKVNDNVIWTKWPSKFKDWVKNKSQDLSCYQQNIDYELFLQFIFYRQWFDLKAYANKHGIEIMGDLPIYAGFDSVDVWDNQDMFLLDDDRNPSFVAGVPPDFFSTDGQLWGNPLYDWDKLESSGFEFWLQRLKCNFRLFDVLRIDHFRAFDTFWKIPADSKTAINGEWIEAPGYKFFDTIYSAMPNANIIAEDLGDLRPQVLELRDHYNLRGMKVFQFHLHPTSKNIDKDFSGVIHTVIYTGTHDNNTLLGWYEEQTKWQQKQLKKFLKANDKNIVLRAIKYSLSTSADYVIVPVQDVLGLDAHARTNTPGKVGSPNWEWKMIDFVALQEKAGWFANQVVLSNRY